MNSLSKKYLNFVLVVGAIIAGIAIGYFVFTTAFKLLLPFIIAYAIAYISDPVVTFMERQMRIPRKFASAIAILSILLIIGSLITAIIYRLIYEIKKLAERLPELFNMISEQANNLMNKGINIYLTLPPEISLFADEVFQTIRNNLIKVLEPATVATKDFAIDFATSLPSILVFIIVLFISAYFMSSDKQKISNFLVKQLPTEWIARIIDIKRDLLLALLGYIRAQLILMSFTFVEVSIGLLIIGVDYAILLALLISIIDALPILGTGTVLIPWAIVLMVSGNLPRALSLVILYGIVLLVRQLLEPKIVGGQIGLYPLVTLMSMYVGLQIFGIIGMILGPITILIIRNLQRAGVFRLWRE
ncbi:sporulation integral membrane protein YtvI [Petroclostridium sp. X23]|jgi:sporulation integral membrane protein YtvI|uniref:sporulation integral membrane protein YtvI n=1 Tax=Petroclostridium sp. X23 TaxID=3045146 RepID=UPI0024AE097F|nr:sporulation integral membrane protein YtvI [Petroclostridium sp. X23]WHH61426.1 sporulation integral membrane protein YtvI [Petroclostridium sp. X23]